MDLHHSLTQVVKKSVFLAIIGLAALVVVPVVLSFAGVIFAFAFIGFLFYLPYHAFVRKPEQVKEQISGLVKDSGAKLKECGLAFWASLKGVSSDVASTVSSKFQAIQPFVVESICGAGLGVLLAFMLNSEDMDPPVVILGGLAGSVLGFLLALSQRQK